MPRPGGCQERDIAGHFKLWQANIQNHSIAVMRGVIRDLIISEEWSLLAESDGLPKNGFGGVLAKLLWFS